jgi:hypothetical protein
MRLAFTLALALVAAACGDKRDESPEPEKAPRPAPRPIAQPEPLEPEPVAGAPNCQAVLDGLDVAAICGRAFALAIVNGPGAQCALVPAADAPREFSLRIGVGRTEAPRLPPRFPADGWRFDRGRTSLARRGDYPWLISVRSRGPGETPLCSGEKIAAIAARVAELLPSDPTAAAVPVNPACDAILPVAALNEACGTRFDALDIGEREGRGDHVCSRGAGRLGVTVSISKEPSPSKGGAPVAKQGGGVAIADVSGGYTVELATSPARGTRTLPCTREQLASLFPGVLARAKKALSRRKK